MTCLCLSHWSFAVPDLSVCRVKGTFTRQFLDLLGLREQISYYNELELLVTLNFFVFVFF